MEPDSVNEEVKFKNLEGGNVCTGPGTPVAATVIFELVLR